MDLSSIKTVQITEKNLNPNGILLFDNYVKKIVSNYLTSWISNSDKTLSFFYQGNPPNELGDVDSVYRGYGVGGSKKTIVANAYYTMMPPAARALTGVNDIDGSHVHGIALLEDKTITGWSMTGYVYPMGGKYWVASGSTLWNQSRHAATGGAFLRNVKKVGADMQASFALLSGDILTGWGQVGSFSSQGLTYGRQVLYNFSLAKYGSGDNNSSSQGWGYSSAYTALFNPYEIINIQTGNCVGLAMDASCTRRISAMKDGYLGTDSASVSFGSRIAASGKKNWSSCAVSYTNTSVAMATVMGGNIWVEQNYGSNWVEKIVGGGPKNWSSISTNYDGKNRTAVISGGNIYVSNDFGSNWTPRGSIQNWSSVSMSSGGKNQTATVYGGNIWTSVDSGTNWNPIPISANWRSVSVAQEGKYQTAVASPGKIYVSSDSGNNWTEKNIPGIRNWSSVSLGFNGDIQLAVSDHKDGSGSAWISTDTGYNWSEITSYITGVLTPTGFLSSVYSSQPEGWNSCVVARGYDHNANSAIMSVGSSTTGMIVSQRMYLPYFSGYASPEFPIVSYPNIYLTGVKDFDIGENYINILLKTGSDDSYMMTGWGSVPARIRKDGLKNVKKIVSTRDHTFALLKSGNTTVIDGWGMNETNLSMFEQWLAGPGLLSGYFTGFLNDYKGWTGIKDFDVGYNHGIAIFEDDKISGWSASVPPEGKYLVGQINNKYKTLLDAKMNFYLDVPSFSGGEHIYFNEVTPYKLRFNQILNQWEAVSDINYSDPVAYRSNGYGSGALLGTWDGVGNSQGQQLEVVNNTVQSIYAIENGEAYVSAVSDKDWIQIDNQNLRFPWNKSIAYVGSTGTPIQLFNFPTGINYNFVSQSTLLTPYEGADPINFQSIYDSHGIYSENFSEYGIDAQGNYHATNSYASSPVTLYPTTDYPLTVYRETSGVSSFAEMQKTVMTDGVPVWSPQVSELFLYQKNSKSGEWILSLKYLKDFLFGSSTFDKGEEIIASQARSFAEIGGYAFPPSGLWNNFYTSNANNIRNVLNTGLRLEYSVADTLKSIDSRTGYMQDINFYIDYSKMLPNYSNPSQVYLYDNSIALNYTKFGANITVKDATSSNWSFNQNGVIEANSDFAVNISRFSGDTAVDWNQSIGFAKCPNTFSTNLYGPLLANDDMPLRSTYVYNPQYLDDPTRGNNPWYIFIKFLITGFKNYSGEAGNRWGSFNWKNPYIFDKLSNTKIPLISEVYTLGNLSRGLPLWSGIADNQQIPIYSGNCHHFQVRLYHPLLNSGGYENQERNIWSQLSTTGTYSGGYLWNGIEDQGSGELSPGLSLERGREYRFIQQKPINDTNKLKIYPSSGVEVFEYDSDNSSDYRFIQVKINSEDNNEKSISWSKGDQSYLTGYSSYPSCTGNYTIGKFYETDITGIVPDPAKPNYVKYSSNQASGEWYFNSNIENKMLGTIRFFDKLYPAEFWYLSGSNYNTWPNNKANGFKTTTAYAFLKSGDTKIPFYGTLVQTAKNINTGVFNPNGNGSSQKHIWNGRFKIIGTNNFSQRASFATEYPNSGDKNPFDINICTDYNRANDPITWELLSQPLAERSGISVFSGIASSGYFFANKTYNFSARNTILCRKNSIMNIVFVPPTQARLTANKIALWTGSSKTGPWAEVTGQVASIFGGNENFYNVDSLTYTDPTVSEVFGEVWQLIQLYAPNTVNSSQIFTKFGPANSNPNCALGTGCRHTNLVVIDDGLPATSPSGYYQLISGNNIFKTTVNYSQPTPALFKGNVNVWSSDPYFTKQMPLQLTGAIDYINY